ncbi:MAG: hypothetical protein GX410_03175 [Elusimicrobia bacterium]|nr:hypothetical protein [Elusimicrobiota bacterium]
MKKQSRKVTPKDLLGTAAFTLSHLLEQGLSVKEAARRLWKEHERHAQAMGLPCQLLMLLRDGRIECSTPHCAELFGADICGHAFLDRITEKSGDTMARRAKDKAEGKAVAKEFILDFVRKDGSTFNGEIAVAEIYSEKGAFALALLVVNREPALAGGAK